MEPQKFVRKPQPVEAVQYDGTTAGAYALLGWLLGLKGTSGYARVAGPDYDGPDGPVVLDQNGRDRFVLKDEWVVVGEAGSTRVLMQVEFADEYEAAPQAAVVGVLGHSHKPGCRCARTRGNLRGECLELDGLQFTSGIAEQRDGVGVAGQDQR